MFIYFGAHHFKRQGIGFRPDFCLSCNDETVSIEVRSFDVGHVWCIPLLPLGFRRDWRCSQCGENPRGERTGQAVKVVGVVALLLAAAVAWATPPAGDDAIMVWAIRLGSPAFAGAIVLAFRERKKEDSWLVDRLRQLPPVGDACPLCGRLMRADARRACGSCGVVESVPPELATA